MSQESIPFEESIPSEESVPSEELISTEESIPTEENEVWQVMHCVHNVDTFSFIIIHYSY